MEDNYEDILKEIGIEYEFENYYLKVGNIPELQGWILYIPIVTKEFKNYLLKVIPYLLNEQIGFKIPIDKLTHYYIKEGLLGDQYLGKVICIYPINQLHIEKLALDLIFLSKDFHGTQIPFSIRLGEIIHTRYGSFHPFTTPEGEFLFDENSNPIKDEYYFPYEIPKFVKWPFGGICTPTPPKVRIVLKKKYFIQETIRNFHKGRVILGLYRRGFFSFNKCLIKEGIPGMFTDNNDRDIQDRLTWQRDLILKLTDEIPIPSLIDFFHEDGNSYLVIEYIEGLSLDHYLKKVLNLKIWLLADSSIKNNIINILTNIVKNLNKLHQLGYVHRDITLLNFMIRNDNDVVLIDLELAYSLNTNFPDPPYQMGTPGYMSPEQEKLLGPPTIEQDTYSIGALLLSVFSGLSPRKFQFIPYEKLFDSIFFFTRNYEVANLILQCLNTDASKRPSIPLVINTLNEHKLRTDEITINSSHKLIGNKNLESIIQKGINNFSSSIMQYENGYWVSPEDPNLETRYVFVGLSKGISGILYFLSYAKGSGFELSSCKDSIQRNLSFLEEHFFIGKEDLPYGYFQGSYGVALSLVSSIKNKLLSDSETIRLYIKYCLSPTPQSLDIYEGVSGHGLSLLYCKDYVEAEFFNEKMSQCISLIISSQQRDGSWKFIKEPDKKSSRSFGFEDGVAGVVYFLLTIYNNTNDQKSLESAQKGLSWLSKHLKKDKKIGSKNSADLNVKLNFKGYVGISYTFLKAYEITNIIEYRTIAESILDLIPSHVIKDDFSFHTGLTGLGEIYLYAFKLLKEQKWLMRSEWIAQVLIHCSVDNDDYVYWNQTQLGPPSGDLMIGNGGILYFLIQFYNAINSKNSYQYGKIF